MGETHTQESKKRYLLTESMLEARRESVRSFLFTVFTAYDLGVADLNPDLLGRDQEPNEVGETSMILDARTLDVFWATAHRLGMTPLQIQELNNHPLWQQICENRGLSFEGKSLEMPHKG